MSAKLLLTVTIFALSVIPVLGQETLILENFNQGTYFSANSWRGDTAKYSVETVNGFSSLRLNAPAETGKAPIYIDKAFNYGVLEFYVNFLFTGLSASNKLQVFFGIDKPSLDGTHSGYVLSGGETGTADVFKLYRIVNGTSTLLASDTTLINDGGEFRLRFEKDTTQTVKLSVGRGRNGDLHPFISVKDTVLKHAGYSILEPNYTSTRANQFVFDSVSISKYRPFLKSSKLVSQTKIATVWSESIQAQSSQLSDFTVNPGNLNPTQIQQSGDSLIIEFAEAIPFGNVTLSIEPQQDTFSILSAAYQVPFTNEATFSKGDILINEFMHNPPSGLVDYIELINVSSKTLSIANWIVRDNNSTNYAIPANISLEPNEIIALSADTTALFTVFGHQNYVKMSSFPGLNNTTADQVRIYTPSLQLVDSLQYDSGWQGSGVSLERKSVQVASVYKENWGPSAHASFGTPGFANTVLPDETAPLVLSTSLISADSISVTFNETIDQNSVQIADFVLSDGFSVQTFEFTSSQVVILKLAQALSENQTYTLTINGISDLFGNTITETITEIRYLATSPAETGDILISEFLYDPISSYTEFIEIYNKSSKYIDIQGFTYNDNSGTRKSITSQSTIIEPQEFIVITPSTNLSAFFPDARIISMGSNFAALNNSGDAIVLRTNSGELLDSLTYTSAWGGVDKSLERRSYAVSATFSENWGDSPNELTATPGKSNEIAPDETAPDLINVVTFSTDSLIINFSERLNAVEAVKNESYTFDNALQIASISVSETGKSVSFKFSPAFNENQVYSGSIISVQDVFGNTNTAAIPFSFEFVETQPADSADVLITEFLYDPPSGYSEFIELYNASDKILDLSNYTYSDNSASLKIITEDSYILKPQEFVVLVPDETIKSIFPDSKFIVMGSRFSSLNNSGDQIVIKNATGITLDSLAYTSAWGGAKVSLERKDNSVSARFNANWGNSPAALFASPSSSNSISPDETAPVLEQILVEASRLLFIFDESLDESFGYQSNISTSLNRTESSRNVSGNVITLQFADVLSATTEFSVTIGNQKDIFGNEFQEETRTVSFVVVKDPILGDLIITEFVYKASDSVPEFIELYNNSDENIALNSLQIADNKDAITLSVKSGYKTFIAPKEYIAISTDEGFSSLGQNRVAVERLPSLNDTGSDAIVIKFQQAKIDSLSYKFPAWSSLTAGRSYERKRFDALSIDPVNWAANPNRSHSAGLKNLADTTLPAMSISFAGWLSEDTLTIYTTQYIESANDVILSLNGTVLSGLIIKENKIRVEETQPLSSESPVIELEYLKTGFENTSTKMASIPASSASLEPFIISEILFNPLTDENARQSDFIEFYNPNSIAVILPSTFLQTQSVSSGSVTTMNLETNGLPVAVPAKTYAIIYPDTVSGLSNSRLGIYFGLSDTLTAFRVNRTSLSLSSTNTAIKLLNTSGEPQDSVHYVDLWHNANVTDTKGRTLERILLNGPSNDATNWTTSGNPAGATPGYLNSNNIVPGAAELNQLLISPNPFSPDEDGFEDNTTINWNLDGTNYLIQATIYDRFGRKVRTLAQNVVAGKSGSLVWDGKRDDGTNNRIGIYILLFKAVDNNSGKEFIKKETIVIARMM